MPSIASNACSIALKASSLAVTRTRTVGMGLAP
jgi:hypothetical protein